MVEATGDAAKLKKIESDFVELERLDRLKNRDKLTDEDYDLWVAYYISVLRLFDVEYSYALQERRSMRLPMGVNVAFSHQGKSFDATTVDLSVGGMAISHQEGIYVGQEVALKFSFGESSEALELKAAVRWVSVLWDRVGLEFLDISPELLETLENGIYGFIRQKLQDSL